MPQRTRSGPKEVPRSHPRGFSPAAPKPAEGRGDPIRAATTPAGELSGLCQPNKGSCLPDLDRSAPGEGEKMKQAPRHHRWRGVKGQLPLCLLAPCPGGGPEPRTGSSLVVRAARPPPGQRAALRGTGFGWVRPLPRGLGVGKGCGAPLCPVPTLASAPPPPPRAIKGAQALPGDANRPRLRGFWKSLGP